MRKLFTFLLALAASVGAAYAYSRTDVKINGIYYTLIDPAQVAYVIPDETSNEPAYSGTVNIPAKVTYNDTEYTVTYIANAFVGCTDLHYITIPSTVGTINCEAFSGCTGLRKITCEAVSPPSCEKSINTIPGFLGVSFDVPVYVPSRKVEAYQKADGWQDFTNIIPLPCEVLSGTCGSNLTWVLDCDSVLTISGTGTMTNYELVQYKTTPWYYYSETIKRVVLEQGVYSVGNYAFWDCYRIQSVSFPSTVSTIGINAFGGCDALKSLTLGSNVQTIRASAFSGCRELSSIDIPSKLTVIADYAFSGCDALTRVNISSLKAWCNISFKDKESNPLYSGGGHLYLNGEEVTELVIPSTVNYIYQYAFCGYIGLTSVEIPNSVTQIDKYAFSSCTGLTSLKLPETLTRIEPYTFNGCTALTSVEIPEGVASIKEYAFYECKALKTIKLPSTLVNIGDKAFCYTNDLKSVTCDALEPPTCGTNAFYGAYYPKLLVPAEALDAYKEAEQWSEFYICAQGGSQDPDDPITPIDPTATSGKCGDNLTWNYADSLLTISGTGDMICEIDFTTWSFNPWWSYSYAIKSVIIEEGATSIGEFAFDAQINLVSIFIPESVTRIAEDAFGGARKLRSLQCEATTPPTCAEYSFYEVDTLNLVIYVPAEAVEAYKAADSWEEFNIQPIQPNEVLELEPVAAEPEKETAITFTVEGASSSAVLLNLQATDSYDESKQCVVLSTTLDDENVAKLMDNLLKNAGDLRSVFSGVSFFLPAGKGEIKLDIQTFGLQLSVHIGNSGVAHLMKNERGEAVVQYDIIEPTLVCIHASVPDADVPARHLAPQQVKDDETRVEFYGIRILPNKVATGVGNIQDANAPCIKFLRDGQLFILRDGKTYTIQGMEVK